MPDKFVCNLQCICSSECIVYCIDESTGGLEVSHACVLSSKDYPGCPGSVTEVCWTPDGCAMAASWSKGGIGLWSTFGTLLMCTLGWDYGLHVDLTRFNPLLVTSMVCNCYLPGFKDKIQLVCRIRTR